MAYKKNSRPVPQDEVEKMLDCISPDCSHDTWFRILAGLKDNGTSKDVAQRWSERGKSYTRSSFNSTWESIKQDGGIAIGTVIEYAKDGGYIPTKRPKGVKTERKDPMPFLEWYADQNGFEYICVYNYEYPPYKGGLLKARFTDKQTGKKEMRWLKEDRRSTPGWSMKDVFNKGSTKKRLYVAGKRLDSVDSVVLCEGEKDADSLHALGFPCAASSPDGASKNGGWYAECTKQLSGKSVVIFMDNDDVGRTFARTEAEALSAVCDSVKIIDLAEVWDDIPEKADVSDYVAMHPDEPKESVKATLDSLIESTGEYTPQGRTKDETQTVADVVNSDTVEKLMNSLGIRIRKNTLTQKVEISGMPGEYSETEAPNTLAVLLVEEIERISGGRIRKDVVNDSLLLISDRNRFNPIKEMLDGTTPDTETDYIGGLADILGIRGQHPYDDVYLRKWLHQCISLALNDEAEPYSADGVLVLQGEQGLGKSSFFRQISLKTAWFGDGEKLDMRDKDSTRRAVSFWICEIGEIDASMGRKELASLKGFLTHAIDRYRVPYGRTETDKPRRTSFCGTVNPEEFLVDRTGNRRFWVVPVTHIDLDRLFSLTPDWIAKMWRQVYDTMYTEKPQGFRLTPAERDELDELNENFTVTDTVEQEILDGLDWDAPVKEWRFMTAAILREEITGLKHSDTKTITATIKRMALKNFQIQEGNPIKKTKSWRLPPRAVSDLYSKGGHRGTSHFSDDLP